MEAADFSGYATKAGLKCSDGRTITPEAFKHMDGMQVPLVWQHGHDSPANVLGHGILEAMPDGMRVHGFFNGTEKGMIAKSLVQHKDITRLSIWANQLVEKSKTILHGMIREVSLVLSGANPEATIDYVQIAHSDGDVETKVDEAIIHTGLDIEFVVDEDEDESVEHSSDDPTLQEIIDSMSPQQRSAMEFVVGAALENATSSVAQSDDSGEGSTEDTNKEGDLTHQEGTTIVTRNVFDQSDESKSGGGRTLSHAERKEIMSAAQKPGATLKSAFDEFVIAHGITDLDILFPDAKNVMDRPEFDKRRTEWVAGVLNGTRHTPFSRIKTMSADLTQEAARAKGYIKGTLKKEEWFGVTKRTTGPATVYKKQKLDRDDIIDIVDFDVVAWMKAEMRMMLEEEIARSILIGDGREVDDEDKIADPAGATSGNGIRSIINDHELYVAKAYVNVGDASSSYSEVVDAVIRERNLWKGTGTPDFYTTETVITNMLLLRDGDQRRMYRTVADLAAELRVGNIIAVEVMEDEPTLLGILVNLQDYNVGADKGGEVNLFDDFDIDYNQFKYLIETRISGALIKIRSAITFWSTASGDVLVNPITEPTFVEATGVTTIPTQTGVVYKNADTGATLSAGAQSALAVGATLNVRATPASGYFFLNNIDDEWSFTRP